MPRVKKVDATSRREPSAFRELVESAGDVMYQGDRDGFFTYANPAAARLTGFTEKELVGKHFTELVCPGHRERLKELYLRQIEEETENTYVEFPLQTRSGDELWMGQNVQLVRDGGEVVGLQGVARDITARRRMEALARENPNPVVQCDARGQPEHANPAATALATLLGYDEVRGILPPEHELLVGAALRDGEGAEQIEVQLGDRIFSWSYRPDRASGDVYIFGVDITGRRLIEEQLRHDALHDALTGLPNRLLFMERLTHAIARARRRETYLFAVLFLDLDRFKVINDSLGHQVGDELLVLIAQRLGRCLRGEDTVARFGGDEFAILLEGITGISDATRVAERIQAELSASVNLGGFDVFTSASIGIALSSTAYERPEYLLRNADMAMYRAKGLGQARFEVFDRAMHAQALARLQLETDLRRAVERGEFVLHYQPIVTMRTGEICGVEALIRWMHPERGMMAPDQFIPVAEETGLILPIGRWVLKEACRNVRVWRVRYGEEAIGTVGVNLSAKQFSQADLADQIADALDSSGLPGAALRLEITESAVMENADAAIILLRQLKALGIQISLDDFGTGYSSLSYLHRFPLDTVKIDRSFVQRIDSEERTTQLVETVLTLARSLGVTAVAEGIETEEQVAALRELDCDFGQGYHFSRPLAPAQLEELLAAR